MRASVIVRKRGTAYVIDVQGRFGGGYQGHSISGDPQEAAIVASREMIRYATTSKEGGDLIAPPEVTALVPEHLRSVPGRS